MADNSFNQSAAAMPFVIGEPAGNNLKIVPQDMFNGAGMEIFTQTNDAQLLLGGVSFWQAGGGQGICLYSTVDGAYPDAPMILLSQDSDFSGVRLADNRFALAVNYSELHLNRNSGFINDDFTIDASGNLSFAGGLATIAADGTLGGTLASGGGGGGGTQASLTLTGGISQILSAGQTGQGDGTLVVTRGDGSSSAGLSFGDAAAVMATIAVNGSEFLNYVSNQFRIYEQNSNANLAVFNLTAATFPAALISDNNAFSTDGAGNLTVASLTAANGFTGTGAFTNFTIAGGIITAAS